MKNPYQTPFAVARLWMAMVQTSVAAAATIAARVGLTSRAISQGQPLPVAEMARMVMEKQAAALASAAAAMEPYRRATTANARRLRRKRG